MTSGGETTAFIRSREQQSATALQCTGNFLDQSALDFGIEQKEEPPGDYAIEGSREKDRIFDVLTLYGNVWKRVRNTATIVGEASTPYTLNPRSIKACEIGTPVPHPRSRTVAPLGNVRDQSAITAAPIPELFRPRPAMNSAATSSEPVDFSGFATPWQFSTRKAAAFYAGSEPIVSENPK